MQDLPDLTTLSHAQKDELIVALWQQVQTLTAQVQQMQAHILHLEGRLSLNSRNSSKPPSSDALAKPAPKSLRAKGQRRVGGQRGHEGNTLRQSAQVDHTIVHQGPTHCSSCCVRAAAAARCTKAVSRKTSTRLPNTAHASKRCWYT